MALTDQEVRTAQASLSGIIPSSLLASIMMMLIAPLSVPIREFALKVGAAIREIEKDAEARILKDTGKTIDLQLNALVTSYVTKIVKDLEAGADNDLERTGVAILKMAFGIV